jgi:enoyl-CoA hydratase/carnithine racemase
VSDVLSSSEDAPVLVARDGVVATITLNRPDKRNAIDQGMRDALASTLADLDTKTEVCVVVLTGAGSAFCAGVDLAESSMSGDPTDRPPVAAPLWQFRKPVVAAINGVAVGGGLELALACDIRIGAASARLGLTEARIGSLPGSGGTQLLPRIVGAGNAARLLLTGELIDASRAQAMGLVSEVVPDENLAAAVGELASRIGQNAPLSLIAAKQALRQALDLPFEQGQALERRLWAELAATEDRAEGRAAFREKRAPRFVGR